MNTAKVSDLKEEGMETEGEDLSISGPLEDHVSANEDDNAAKTSLPPSFTPLEPLNDNYSKKYQILARYLTTLIKPNGYLRGEYRKLKKEALNYSIRDRIL